MYILLIMGLENERLAQAKGKYNVIPAANTPELSIPKDLSERTGGGATFETELLAARTRLRGYAQNLTKNPTEAEDLTQRTLEKAMASKQQFQEGTSLLRWAFTIMRNLYLSEERSRNYRGRKETELIWKMENRDRLTNQEVTVQLQQTLEHMRRLPDDQREAIMLIARGYTHEEIAELKNIPEGTVKSRVARGRETLRQMMGIEGKNYY